MASRRYAAKGHRNVKEVRTMKGTDVDNRRSLRNLSDRARSERQLAKLIREDKLEVDGGELRPKTSQQSTTATTTEPVYELPPERWE